MTMSCPWSRASTLVSVRARRFDGGGADIEPSGDLGVGQALGVLGEDAAFPVGWDVERAGVDVSRFGRPLDECLDEVAGDPG